MCTATATVPLIVPQTMFDDRLTRLDLRIAKRFDVTSRTRLQANFNIYNVFNGSASSVAERQLRSVVAAAVAAAGWTDAAVQRDADVLTPVEGLRTRAALSVKVIASQRHFTWVDDYDTPRQ